MRANFANLAALTLLTACSQAPDSGAAPDVGPSAAPGVAFTYRYAFALNADHLPAAQEGHARACEALGLARCRVTGFRYRVTGRDSASGRLEMRLVPDIARRFGQQGVASVRSAGGTLVDAEATGTDAGVTGDAAAEQRRSLAATPVIFDYESGTGLSPIDTGAPLRSAAAAALASARVTLAVTLGTLALAAPPAAALALLLLLAHRLRPAWRRLLPWRDAAPAR